MQVLQKSVNAEAAHAAADLLAPHKMAALSDDFPLRNRQSALCIFTPRRPSRRRGQQQFLLAPCYHGVQQLLLQRDVAFPSRCALILNISN